MRNWTTFNLPFAQNVFFIFCLFAESKTIFAAHSFYFISFYFFLYLHLRLTWRGRAHAEQFYSLICTHANTKHSKYVFFFSVRLIIRLYCLIMRLSLTDWLTMRTAKRRDRNRKNIINRKDKTNVNICSVSIVILLFSWAAVEKRNHRQNATHHTHTHTHVRNIWLDVPLIALQSIKFIIDDSQICQNSIEKKWRITRLAKRNKKTFYFLTSFLLVIQMNVLWFIEIIKRLKFKQLVFTWFDRCLFLNLMSSCYDVE